MGCAGSSQKGAAYSAGGGGGGGGGGGPGSFGKKYTLDSSPNGELGSGAFSTVRLAVKVGHPEESYAVKCITKTGELKQDEIDSLHEEVRVLQSIDHSNIIKLFDFYEEPKMYYVVTELLQGGELFDRIIQKTFYNEKEARQLVRILLDCLNYMHTKNIVHRDLKPENLLLKSKTDDFDIKLADFGFAKPVDGRSLDTQCGTPGYVAPEILMAKKYGLEVDMWSCGVIIFILLGGYPPFHEENHSVLYRKIKAADYEFDPEYWSAVSDDAKDLIRKLLVVEPNDRLTASAALRHPWFLVGDHVLMERSLEQTIHTMKTFNAKRKLKGTVKGIIMANRLAKGTF